MPPEWDWGFELLTKNGPDISGDAPFYRNPSTHLEKRIIYDLYIFRAVTAGWDRE